MKPHFAGLALALSLLLVGCRQTENLTPSPSPKTAILPPRIAPKPKTALLDFPSPSPIQVERARNDNHLFALTFDAGSDAKAVLPILKELQARQVKATFFLTGKFCERYPKEVRAIADAGMELGNHSYSHPRFTRLSEAQIREQLERGERAIMKACGRGAKPLFRYPFGDSDARVQKIVAKCGYQAVYWSLDSLDAFRENKTADYVVNRYATRLKGGQISLMHVSSLGSAHALPRVFARLERLGLRQVPVGDIVRESLSLKDQSSRKDTKSPRENGRV